MKVALNLEATGWLGGRYYLRNLALALRANAPDIELVAVGPPDAEFVDLEAFATVTGDADVVFRLGAEGANSSAARDALDPDLQHRALPDYFGRVERLRRDRGYRRLGKHAVVVVVSSEVTRAAVAEAYPRLAPKLRVLHFASSASAGAGRDVLNRHRLPEQFVLLPNQFWAHKNHETAFAAATGLPQQLVCTGATEDHRRPGHVARLLATLERSGAADRVRILGVVPRDDYLGLVRQAAALLQPSLFEGWSSVVEDARAYGRPIALSDIPVHREQDPPLAFFFKPRDAADLTRAVRAACRRRRSPTTTPRHSVPPASPPSHVGS